VTRRRDRLQDLLKEVRACRICKGLPLGPRPILEAGKTAGALIIGQAPGTRVHETGIPWNDPSGDRLREWLQIDREAFYDPRRYAIVPMGFCYPGKGKSGDLPPREECAPQWHERILAELPQVGLKLLIGRYAQSYYLAETQKKTLTETVRNWRDHPKDVVALPHPSPRNNLWLRRNPWFETEVLPLLRRRHRACLRKSRETG